MRFPILNFILIGLVACSSLQPPPLQESDILPQQLAQKPSADYKGQVFTWGGVIIARQDYADRSLLEILSYPLDQQGFPLANRPAQGRFLADYAGRLPDEFQAGLMVTVQGPLLGYLDRRLGDQIYHYPALKAEQLRLPHGPAPRLFPSINFGIGWDGDPYGGIGIGIGF